MARKEGIEGRCPPKAVELVVAERQLEDPLAAVIRSRSGGGNSVIVEIERLTSSEDVTRWTSQRLEPVFLDRRLVIVEEPCKAGWTIRVLSR